MTGTSLRDLLRTGLAMRRDQDLTWAQVAMAANAPMLTKAAMVDGRPEVGILPTGQAVGAIDTLPTVAELLDSIESQARAPSPASPDGFSTQGFCPSESDTCVTF